MPYGLERLTAFLQAKDSVYDIVWAPGFSYGDVRYKDELQYSVYNFEMADISTLWKLFDLHEGEATRLLKLYDPESGEKKRFPLLPAYDRCSSAPTSLTRWTPAAPSASPNASASSSGYARWPSPSPPPGVTSKQSRDRQGARRAQLARRWPSEPPQPCGAGCQGYPLGPDRLSIGPGERSSPVDRSPLNHPRRGRPMTTLPFLLEIGTEEIPDWMIPSALENLRLSFEKLEIPHESLRLDATPRRLVLRAEGLPVRQPDSVDRVLGPPKSAPPQAVAGFARKQGIQPDEMKVEATPKGDY